jgi:Ser/Thr protein kinase RdoA (MazF antagonist)
MLELADVAPYLLDQGLISPRAVVDGGLRVVDRSRLNRVYVVTADGERCLVLKLAAEPGYGGIEHEALVLEKLRSRDPGGPLASSLPVLVACDADQGLLILEATPTARDLARHHRGGRFSATLAREAGRMLGVLHSLPTSTLPRPGAATFGQSLGAYIPALTELQTMSTAEMSLLRLVQHSEELCRSLDELAIAWREETIVHGDVRWDNCLAVRDKSGRWRRLQLIDWETAGPGDPAEDVGAFLGEYLRTWLQSIPDLDPRERLTTAANARYPLVRMQPALRGFWLSYCHHRHASPAQMSTVLRRATRYAAARILMSALEDAQLLPDLHRGLLNALQLSRAVFRRPDEAAAHLLGLRASRSAT